MKKMRIIPFLFIFLSVYTLTGQTKNLDIAVKGIEEVKGQIVVLVFENKEDFPKDQKLARTFLFPVSKKEMTVTLKGLPVKDCAVMLYHDQDKNGKCNQNFIGMPVEKIGFSNNLRPKVRAPKFEDARIRADQTRIAIELYKM